jgi:polysaccharide biosynthesis transport protein
MSDLVPTNGPPPRFQAPEPGNRDLRDEPPLDTERLRGLLGALRNRWWAIALAGAAGFAVAFWLVSQERPRFQSVTVISVDDTRRAVTGGLEGAADPRWTGRADPLTSQIEVLRSSAVLGMVVDRHHLRLRSDSEGFSLSRLEDVRVAEFAEDGEVGLRFHPDGVEARAGDVAVTADYGNQVQIAGLTFTVPERPTEIDRAVLRVVSREAAIGTLRSRLSTSVRPRTNIVELAYVGPDPSSTQETVNGIAQAFHDFSVTSARQRSQLRRSFIESQLQEAQQRLSAAEGQLTDFRRRHRVLSSRQRFSSEQAGLLSLDLRRSELEADRRMYLRLLSRLEQAEPGETGQALQALVSAPELAGNTTISSLYSRLVEYEAERAGATTGQYARAETNPDVARLDALIEATERRIVSAAHSHIEWLDARITELDRVREENAEAIAALPEVEAEEARLVHDLELVRREADRLREEFQRARISEAVELGDVEILDRATRPGRRLDGGRERKLALGLVVGLMLGSGGVLLLEGFNTTIRRREEIERDLHLPSLAIIPRVASAAAEPSSVGRLVGGDRLRRLLPGQARIAGEGERPLVTVTDGQSAGAEAYRTLRTNLIFSQAIQSLRTIVVTSASPEEGKTTTAANLAVTFAQQGMRVGLVDCDLRRPRLHRVFDMKPDPGLTQCMLNGNGGSAAFRPTAVSNLHLLPSGPVPPNPAELLGSEALGRFMEKAATDFDVLILDSSPLAAGSDAAILASRADGVILVLRAGETDRAAARHALQQLGTVGARVVGAVLNDPDAQIPRYAEYYAYGYGTDYRDDAPSAS